MVEQAKNMIMEEWKRRPEIPKGMANLRNRAAELEQAENDKQRKATYFFC